MQSWKSVGIIIARDATSSSSENSFISNSFQGNFNERRLMLQMLKLHFEMPLAATSSSLQLFSKSKEIFSNLKKNTEDYFYTIYALAQSNHHDAIYGKICSFVMICICICISTFLRWEKYKLKFVQIHFLKWVNFSRCDDHNHYTFNSDVAAAKCSKAAKHVRSSDQITPDASYNLCMCSVCLCICMCVIVYLCICVFLFVYLCICVFGCLAYLCICICVLVFVWSEFVGRYDRRLRKVTLFFNMTHIYKGIWRSHEHLKYQIQNVKSKSTCRTKYKI